MKYLVRVGGKLQPAIHSADLVGAIAVARASYPGEEFELFDAKTGKKVAP